MAEDSQSDFRIIQYKDWQASRARLQSAYGTKPGPTDADGPAPPATSDQGENAAFVVIQYKDWHSSRARLLTALTPLAADESSAGPPPPSPESPSPQSQWPNWRRPWARNRAAQATAQDLDAPVPPAITDAEGGGYTVIQYKDWQASRAAQQSRWATSVPAEEGLQQPDTLMPFMVIPWFAGMTPAWAFMLNWSTADTTGNAGPVPFADRAEPSTVHRGMAADRSRWSPRWSQMLNSQNVHDDVNGPPTFQRSFYIPNTRPRRR